MASGLKGNVPCNGRGDQPGAASVLFRVVGALAKTSAVLTAMTAKDKLAWMPVFSHLTAPGDREEWGGGEENGAGEKRRKEKIKHG